MNELISQLLYQRIGFDIQSVGSSMLDRVVQQQMQKFQCSAEQYLQGVQQSTDLWLSLVEAMMVPETWFYRYPKSFALMAELVAELLKEQLKSADPATPIRILSLPCSSGEEAYSIAIYLLNAGVAPQQFVIDAIDINRQVLEQAAIGLYRENSFRETDTGLRDRYFDSSAKGCYQLKPGVRALVRFNYGNLFAAGALGNTSYDLIFCRNLLIYFDTATQIKAVSLLRQVLKSTGYLFSGPAEAGVFSRAGMQSLAKAECFAYANTQLPPAPASIAKKSTLLNNKPLGSTLGSNNLASKNVASKNMPGSVKTAAGSTLPRQAIAGKSQRPAVKINDPTKTVDNQQAKVTNAANMLATIEQLANQGFLAEALQCCAAGYEQAGPSAELFYWWGLIYDSNRDSANAEKYYRKSLYYDPLHSRTIAQLSRLLKAKGDVAAAALIEQRLATSGG
ncbi:protein-glutamate O-methyltransferase CheR [Rheinheimera riviphila]|uniref:Protein-glutamate O-methyltransferase CheR n=1 Tax=Rheinheimera riviphila TaxID=1834037 RepID=A0A437R1G6_9GAMM|nr:protein-glutamate O-methyltransferase CheR [Rheinheimera riviphila]RVU40578.1 protein-glutamate O-methyltransferase CheR [Rheinheimera riviphila]